MALAAKYGLLGTLPSTGVRAVSAGRAAPASYSYGSGGSKTIVLGARKQWGDIPVY